MTTPLPVLKRGSKQKAAVIELQDRLKSLGWIAVGPSDGDFGRMTELVVSTFQASVGLDADGVVGQKTWDALAAAERGENPLEITNSPVGNAPNVPDPWVRELLRIACNELGIAESPNGSNGGPRVDIYTGKWRVAWCALYVSWCANQQDKKVIDKPIAASARWADWLRARGRWRTNAATSPPQPGDIFCILSSGKTGVDPGLNHVGFIVDWDPVQQEILTNEGNCGNAVRSIRRKVTTLSGWGRIAP